MSKVHCLDQQEATATLKESALRHYRLIQEQIDDHRITVEDLLAETGLVAELARHDEVNRRNREDITSDFEGEQLEEMLNLLTVTALERRVDVIRQVVDQLAIKRGYKKRKFSIIRQSSQI